MNDDDKLEYDDIKSVEGNFIQSLKKWQSAGRPIVSKTIWNNQIKSVVIVSGGKKFHTQK